MADRSLNQFDVFLSYHWRDREPVERIARALRNQGLKPFLDRWYLVPGRPWPQALEQTLASCQAVAVCIGPGEMGPWQTRESNFALERQGGNPDFRVIPVLLPGSDPVLGFLGQNTWIDLRQGTDDPGVLSLLAGAIRSDVPAPDLAERIRATRATLCPFRGLLYFREEDAPFFFGRQATVGHLYEAIKQYRFLAVVGPSGSGKSSVVRAGLVPQLRQEKDTIWDVAILFPGDEPLKALARAVSPLLEPQAMNETDRLVKINKLGDALARQDVNLHDIGLKILEKQAGTNRLLLIIDQAEELYTVAKNDHIRRRFIDEILDASERGSWTVMLTLRGDFVGKVLSYRPLSDRLQGAQINVGSMTRTELEQTITYPARRVEMSFADGLVARILDDVGDEPGHLPLLEFVLKRLWEDCQGPEMSHQAYDAMGGLQGAVAKRAEEFFATLTPLEQDAVKRVFLHVVRVSETGEDTSRRAAFSEIGPAVLDVVKKLVDERLLVTNRAVAGEETVEVSHEALIRQWHRLQGWLKEDRKSLLWRERLRGRVNDWKYTTQDEGTLLRGALLVEAQRWLSQKAEMLTSQEQDYIRQSVEACERAVLELAQAKRLAEEATKREDAERARAAAAEQAQKAAEEARLAQEARAQEAEQARELEARRAEAAEQAMRRKGYFSLALGSLLLAIWIITWFWQRGYTVDQAWLKVESLFFEIHQEPNMVSVQGGTFQMGGVDLVTIKSFALGKYEITFDEYDRFAIAVGRRLPEDQRWGRSQRPVINVSWGDAKAYAEWLSAQTGKRYRLPTESEWEYAARGTTKKDEWSGTSIESELKGYAVNYENSGGKTQPVRSDKPRKPNDYGLHDMSGNVWEWVQDCYEEVNEENCGTRVIRGGSWNSIPVTLRVSNRLRFNPVYRYNTIGFRLARDLEP